MPVAQGSPCAGDGAAAGDPAPEPSGGEVAPEPSGGEVAPGSANDAGPAAIARRLAAGLAEAAPLPGAEHRMRMRELLVEAHEAVLHAIVEGAAETPHALADLAAVVRENVPPAVLNPMPIRVRVFFRLLARGALAPAFTLAGDNAVGVVRESRSVVRWAGGKRATNPLPLPTMVDGGRVFAWLPGFRDPRFDVPDSVYDVMRNVKLAGWLQYLAVDGDTLMLAGSAFLTALRAAPDDAVTVIVTAPDGTAHRLPAQRVRSPQHVKRRGADLTRLAWAGFQAELSLAELADRPGRHELTVEVAHGAVRRSGPVGVRRGPLAASITRMGPYRLRGRLVGVDSASDGQLSIVVVG